MEGTKTIIRSVVQSPTQRGYGWAEEERRREGGNKEEGWGKGGGRMGEEVTMGRE